MPSAEPILIAATADSYMGVEYFGITIAHACKVEVLKVRKGF
jgi:hypothetical protein